MAHNRTIQLYRGTTAQNDAFTGAIGELTMDTTTNELRLHDGTTAGGHKIGGNGYHPGLFAHEWDDHLRNDVQWLRADTFSWQDGGVYEAAYNHLVDDIDGKTLQSETIAGTTVQFYLADDGHKICPAAQESNVAAIYTATGVAWYYIVDTANQRFKLPRVEPDKENLINTIKVVSDGTDPTSTSSLGTGTLSAGFNVTGYPTNGACWAGITNSASSYPVKWNNSGLKGDVVNSDSFYAGKQHLYFYVGSFTQTALENTAGLNAGLFNGKADIDLSNINPSSSAKQTIAGWTFPDYTAAVSRSANVDYSETSNGYLVVKVIAISGDGQFKIKIGDTTYSFYQGYSGTDYAHPSVGFIPLGKGTSYKITTLSNTLSAVFIPCIGG